MKTLVIARHAKSDWSSGLADHDRPLNARGKEDAPRMGKALENIGFMPELILSSTAVRARATAESVARTMGFHAGVRTDANLYETGYNYIFELLKKQSNTTNNVMIFGHNPILEELINHLLGTQNGIILPTSGMVCLETSIFDWAALQPGQSQLKWFLIPKLLY